MEQPPIMPTTKRSVGSFDEVLGWVCVGVLSVLAITSALWAMILLPPSDPFLHPQALPRIGESLLLAGPGLFFITLYAGRAARSRIGALIPALLWLAVVVTASAGRPEGDSAYLLASYQGLLFAPLGMVAAALGITQSAKRPWPAAVPRSALALPADDQVGSV